MRKPTTFYLRSSQTKQVYGPLSLEELKQLEQSGKISKHTLISPDQSHWVEAENFLDETLIQGELLPKQPAPENFTSPAAQKMFGRYHLEKELGRGGMGVVYLAFDSQLERRVALKILSASGWVRDPKQLQRFKREAQIMGQLNHPYLIGVLESGEQPQPFITMEYIEGESLQEIIAKKTLTLPQKVELFYKICQGMKYAHHEATIAGSKSKGGVVHRDLKPGNILITKDGEPKIMDFGLAHRGEEIGAREQLSQTGETMGTPQYMSPEQAEGEKTDHRTDIYSLGACFYELLTGRPPFQGETVLNILSQLANEDPIPPRKLNPEIPIDLELITLKCLAKSSHLRYKTTGLLVRDLKNYQEKRPISLRAPGPIERSLRWLQRNKTLSSILLLSVIGVISSFFWLFTALRVSQLQQEVISKKSLEIASYFHNQNLSQAQQILLSHPDIPQFQWLRGIILLLQEDYQAADKILQPLLKEFSTPLEQSKLHLLLLLTSENKQQQQEHLQQAKQKLYAAYAASDLCKQSLTDYLQNLDKQNQQSTPLPFLPPKIFEKEDFAKLTLKEARYTLLWPLFPHDFAQAAWSRLTPRKQQQQKVNLPPYVEKLEKKIYKLEYLLSSQQPKWVKEFSTTTKLDLLSLQECLFYVKGKWILNMASAFWTYLPPEKQKQYAAAYQQAYAKELQLPIFKKVSHNSVEIEFVLIPPGQGLIGTGYSLTDEGPLHQVVISQPFWMQRNEFSIGQVTFIPNATKPKKFQEHIKKRVEAFASSSTKTITTSKNYKNTYQLDSPLVIVQPHLLKGLIKKKLQKIANFNLPHETQWEYACRAGYSTNWLAHAPEKLDAYAWYKRTTRNSQGQTEPQLLTNNKKPNTWQLYNMPGSVAEWCRNRMYSYSIGRKVDPQTDDLEKLEQDDTPFIVRGGYFFSPAYDCRASLRREQVESSIVVGFRLIQPIKK